MKTIALEQLDNRLAEALEEQRLDDPLVLTKGSDALGLLLRLPEGTKDSDVDGVFWLEEPTGRRLVVIIEAKCGPQHGQEGGRDHPVFGSCKGMLTIVSEDDEHLKDFEEYME
jgi:hypothetical protein